MPVITFKNLKIALIAGLLVFASCVTDDVNEFLDLPETEQTEVENGYWTGAEFSSEYKSSPDAIYSLRNVQKAFDAVAGERRTRAFELAPTHKYVRLLPQDTTDIYIIVDSLDLDLTTFPIDRELTEEEMDRHQNTKFNGYAWQYCVVDIDFELPTEMESELLDYAYLQPDDEETATRSGETYQLDPEVYYDIISKSMELTGNAAPETRASAWQPSAEIRHIDPAGTGVSKPIVGLHVRVNTDLNTGNGYTNGAGQVVITKGAGGKFRNKVHYIIIWESQSGQFKVHDSAGKAKSGNPTWIKAAWRPTYAFAPMNYDSFCATIYRALSEYYAPKFGSAVDGLTKISSVNVQEHWGQSYYSDVIDGYSPGYFSYNAPTNKIHIYSKNGSSGNYTTDQIYSTTFHELGHASHFQNVVNTSGLDRYPHFANANRNLLETWARGIQYAYMNLYDPEYVDGYSGNYTAVMVSLLNQGVTVAQMQTIMTRSGKTTLEQCRSSVKAITSPDIPDELVDFIFDFPIFPLLENVGNFSVPGLNNPALNSLVAYGFRYDKEDGLPAGATLTYNVSGGSFDRMDIADGRVAIKLTSPSLFTITATFTLPSGKSYVFKKVIDKRV